MPRPSSPNCSTARETNIWPIEVRRWRELLKALGLEVDKGTVGPASAVPQPDPVEPAEIALLLLNNAMRLIDESMAPAAVKHHLATAMRELEEYTATRGE